MMKPHQFGLDEEIAALRALARTHIAAKKIFVSENEVQKRSEEKGITYAQARKELFAESKKRQEQLVDSAKGILKPRLSKEVKRNLGIKETGRPKGSKGKAQPKFSKPALDAVLKKSY